MIARRVLMVVAATAAVGLWTPVLAQRRPGARIQQRQELERRVRQRMGQMIRRELGLSNDEQKALSAVMSEFQGRRRELARREGQVRYKANGLATGKLEMTEEEQRELLAETAALREEEARLFKEEQERLLDVLSPAQLVKFNALRERFAQQIQRLRRRGGPGPGRPPGRPPGAGGPGGVDGPGAWAGPGTLTPAVGLF